MGWLHLLSAWAIVLLDVTRDDVTQVHPSVTSHNDRLPVNAAIHPRSVTHGNQLCFVCCIPATD